MQIDPWRPLRLRLARVAAEEVLGLSHLKAQHERRTSGEEAGSDEVSRLELEIHTLREWVALLSRSLDGPPAGVTGCDPGAEVRRRVCLASTAWKLGEPETEVLCHLAMGLGDREIGALLQLDEATVAERVAALQARSGCEQRLQLIVELWTM